MTKDAVEIMHKLFIQGDQKRLKELKNESEIVDKIQSFWSKYKVVEHCPFCGDYFIMIKYKSLEGWYVFCDVCQIPGPIGRTEKSAVAKWNYRPTPEFTMN